MNEIIKSVNLNDGEVLTLEKFSDRMEFEAFAPGAGQQGGAENMICIIYIDGDKLECQDYFGCKCDCPMVSYEPCQPNKA